MSNCGFYYLVFQFSFNRSSLLCRWREYMFINLGTAMMNVDCLRHGDVAYRSVLA